MEVALVSFLIGWIMTKVLDSILRLGRRAVFHLTKRIPWRMVSIARLTELEQKEASLKLLLATYSKLPGNLTGRAEAVDEVGKWRH
jgi:hypothetical protein